MVPLGPAHYSLQSAFTSIKSSRCVREGIRQDCPPKCYGQGNWESHRQLVTDCHPTPQKVIFRESFSYQWRGVVRMPSTDFRSHIGDPFLLPSPARSPRSFVCMPSSPGRLDAVLLVRLSPGEVPAPRLPFLPVRLSSESPPLALPSGGRVAFLCTSFTARFQNLLPEAGGGGGLGG